MLIKHRGSGQKNNFNFSILIIFTTYILGLTYGYFTFQPGTQLPNYISGSTPSFNFFFILLNNLFVTLIIIFSGFISFGLLPIILTFREAYHLSIGLQQLAYQKGIPYIKLFCIGILPHGIFEIPAFILSCTLGFYLGLKLFKKLPKLDIKYSLQELSYFLEIYHYNVSPLLLWAGILEIHLTPFLILNFL